MRHFLRPAPIPEPLHPRCVSEPTVPRPLVLSSRRPHVGRARQHRAAPRAVPKPAVTPPAQQELPLTERADLGNEVHAADRAVEVDKSPRPCEGEIWLVALFAEVDPGSLERQLRAVHLM
jgi:hypothetical protein